MDGRDVVMQFWTPQFLTAATVWVLVMVVAEYFL
jgi:hypothetical protein